MIIKELTVALVGFPNAGKSTLLNALMALPLASTSRAAGTTRRRVIGITRHTVDEENVLIQWVDAPGFFQQPRRGQVLERKMHEEAINVVNDSDIVCLVLEQDKKMQEASLTVRNPNVVVLNKVDQVKHKPKLFPMLQRCQTLFPESELIPLAAKTQDGVDRFAEIVLRKGLSKARPVPEEEYEDLFTLNSQRQIAHDWIRGLLLEGLHQELPMATDVMIEEFDENETDVRIRASIYVQRKSQKGIVIGKGAERVKRAGSDAREVLKKIFDKEIHLNLFVQTKENWSQKEGMLNELGY